VIVKWCCYCRRQWVICQWRCWRQCWWGRTCCCIRLTMRMMMTTAVHADLAGPVFLSVELSLCWPRFAHSGDIHWWDGQTHRRLTGSDTSWRSCLNVSRRKYMYFKSMCTVSTVGIVSVRCRLKLYLNRSELQLKLIKPTCPVFAVYWNLTVVNFRSTPLNIFAAANTVDKIFLRIFLKNFFCFHCADPVIIKIRLRVPYTVKHYILATS